MLAKGTMCSMSSSLILYYTLDVLSSSQKPRNTFNFDAVVYSAVHGHLVRRPNLSLLWILQQYEEAYLRALRTPPPNATSEAHTLSSAFPIQGLDPGKGWLAIPLSHFAPRTMVQLF